MSFKYHPTLLNNFSGNKNLKTTLYNYRYINVTVLLVSQNNPFLRLLCEFRFILKKTDQLFEERNQIFSTYKN